MKSFSSQIAAAVGLFAFGVMALPAEVEARNTTSILGGTTLFTADGYYNTDCTGNKYWSYEVSYTSQSGCLNENSEIGSVWVHNYGECPDDQVHIGQYDVTDCVPSERIAGQFASRGQCVTMINHGWGDRSIYLRCEPRP